MGLFHVFYIAQMVPNRGTHHVYQLRFKSQEYAAQQSNLLVVSDLLLICDNLHLLYCLSQ